MRPEASISDKIAATRRYAPPLVTIGQFDRRGARLRQINRRAIDYARSAGLPLEIVYPTGLVEVRALAPPADSAEAPAFVRASGMRESDVYPTAFAGETSTSRWRWGRSALWFVVGACAGGPIWALAGGVFGGLR